MESSRPGEFHPFPFHQRTGSQVEREVFIWDLGGQQEYRLVNQLFLPETTLAMILFDPTRGRAAFEDVREWNLRLKKQTERPGAGQRTVKLLVGTKLDTGDEVVDRAEINRLVAECGFVAYFPTSALSPRGLAELGKAIIGQIKWDELLKTTRPRLFQRDHSLIRVHTRCMRRESGAWGGWAVWPGDDAFGKKAFYEIKLTG